MQREREVLLSYQLLDMEMEMTIALEATDFLIENSL